MHATSKFLGEIAVSKVFSKATKEVMISNWPITNDKFD
jgi:hypothetical protein